MISKTLLLVILFSSFGTAAAQNQSTAQPSPTPCAETEGLKKNLSQLNSEVQRLRSRVSVLEKEQQAATIQDQLTKEEQRGESLQLRLLDNAEKDAALQAKLDQLNEQLKPGKIESNLAGVGSLRPEDAREDIRTRLTNERQRVQNQIDLLRQDRARTQSSLITTDASIRRLKIKLAEALRKF